MLNILRLQASASLASVQQALARTKAPQIALQFPLGLPAAIAKSTLLNSLHAFCEQLGREVAIIGGDETLRAVAVAAGFVAATSVEEWAAASRALAAREAEPQPHKRRRTGAPPLQPQIALIGDDLTRDAVGHHEFGWEHELPAYVMRLVEGEGSYTGPHEIPDLPGRSGARVTRPLPALDDDERLRAVSERYEEDITATIRDTGGVTGTLPETPRWHLDNGGSTTQDTPDTR
jgi:hypothetical protein